jgi:hypothetical protein
MVGRCRHLQRHVEHCRPAKSLQSEAAMKGVITGREILSNLWVVWKEFGTGCVVRCFWACMSGHGDTFLELAVKPRMR